MPKVSKYITHIQPKLDLIEAWYRNGAIDVDVARNLNVGYSTYLKYKNDYPELKERTQVGKEEADLKVESALFKRATGYDYDEVKEEYEDGELSKRTVIKKHVAPDTTAQIYWLKNRDPNNWKDKQDINVSSDINNPFKGLTTEELKKLISDG